MMRRGSCLVVAAALAGGGLLPARAAARLDAVAIGASRVSGAATLAEGVASTERVELVELVELVEVVSIVVPADVVGDVVIGDVVVGVPVDESDAPPSLVGGQSSASGQLSVAPWVVPGAGPHPSSRAPNTAARKRVTWILMKLTSQQ